MFSWLGSLQLFGLLLLPYRPAQWLPTKPLTSSEKDLAIFLMGFPQFRWHLIGSDWIKCHLGYCHHGSKEMLFWLAKPESHRQCRAYKIRKMGPESRHWATFIRRKGSVWYTSEQEMLVIGNFLFYSTLLVNSTLFSNSNCNSHVALQ